MHPGVASALAAALLFGASTPLAKMFAGEVPAVMLAGLLYAGSGIGLALTLTIRHAFGGASARIAWPARSDRGWLAGAVLFGGVLGPGALMYGLAATTATSAALLLNLEGVMTALLAWFVFRENFDGRIALGMAAIGVGGAILAWDPARPAGLGPGALLVTAACLCWAIDNNLTRKVAGGDAVVIACIKGVVAGAINLGIAFALGQAVPGPLAAAFAAVVGFAGYGVSLVLFVVALRHLGTARTGAYFAIAPFVGAGLALVLMREPMTLQLVAAGALMASGVWLHITEAHAHRHVHAPLAHEHAHRHDEHHGHEHAFAWDGSDPHTHHHEHPPIEHTHAHYPDLHHRHRHG